MSLRTRPRTETGVDLSAPLKTLYHSHETIVDRLHGLAGLPALAEQAEQARQVASAAVALFRTDVLAHHLDEEHDLFPAVLASARPDGERESVQALVEQLTQEHR